jgi:hypothetical protein
MMHAAHLCSTADMDLCCLLDSKGPQLQASDLVTMLGDLLERGEHRCRAMFYPIY